MRILTNEQYHAHDSISKTQLDIFNNNPNGLQWAKDCPVDSEKVKAFDFGDACHAILLEPERIESDFFVMPELNMRSSAVMHPKKNAVNSRELTAKLLIENDLMPFVQSMSAMTGKNYLSLLYGLKHLNYTSCKYATAPV